MKKAVYICAAAVALLGICGVASAATDGWGSDKRKLSAIRAEGAKLTEVSCKKWIDPATGKKYWLRTWKRGNYVWTNTNEAYQVKGKFQTNTYNDRLKDAQKEAKKAEKVEKAAAKAKEKDAKNLEKAIKDMEKARDKSSEAMKEVYDGVLELLNGAEVEK